ncbi:exosortase/archaeosortase family protein [Thermodesulfobacteriota bacterium]
MDSTNQVNRKASTLTAISMAVVFSATFIFAYFPVWKILIMSWYGSDDYSHGFFIVPISLFIIWQKRQTLSQISIHPSVWGLVLVVFSLLLYLVAHFAEIVTLSSFSMVLFLAGAVLYLYSYGMLKELLFPLFLLLFMIPVPAQIYATLTIPLQLFVSKASVWLASLFGLPVYREGNVIDLPNHTLQVVQACSGLRSMISLLTLGAVFGYFTLRSNVLRTILFLSGIPAAIFVNIIRILVMILAFYYFNYDLTTGSIHTVFGVIIFMLALLFIAMMKGILLPWDKSTAQE